MKIYLSPETKSLTVTAQFTICADSPAPAPGRSGQLGTMKVKNVSSWD